MTTRRSKAYAGFVGNSFQVPKAHKIEYEVHYNGSGKDKFGGADNWPVLQIDLSLQETTQDWKLSLIWHTFNLMLRVVIFLVNLSERSSCVRK